MNNTKNIQENDRNTYKQAIMAWFGGLLWPEHRPDLSTAPGVRGGTNNARIFWFQNTETTLQVQRPGSERA